MSSSIPYLLRLTKFVRSCALNTRTYIAPIWLRAYQTMSPNFIPFTICGLQRVGASCSNRNLHRRGGNSLRQSSSILIPLRQVGRLRLRNERLLSGQQSLLARCREIAHGRVNRDYAVADTIMEGDKLLQRRRGEVEDQTSASSRATEAARARIPS